MNTILKVVDRIGLTLIQVAVLAGLPLVALGVITNGF